MDYKVIRSKRKTIAIYIRDNEVEVRTPLNMLKSDIDRFVLSKEKWIKDNLAKSKEKSVKREEFSLNYGDKILFRGIEYTIVAKDGNRAGFDEKEFFMPKGMTPEHIKATCVHLYRILAKKYLTHRTIEIAKQMSVAPKAIKINSSRTRWGSCSQQKSINYSWRLILADDEVIDYVIAHELAHLTEMNHSDRFWKIVENVYPDFQVRRMRLRELQKKLYIEKWE